MAGVRDDLGRLLVRGGDEIAAMPWEPVGIDGVEHKVLWRSGDNVVGLIRVPAGARSPEHIHLGAHHHIWITAGSCEMAGHKVAAGSYVYIPPGVPHAVEDVGEHGCEYLYTYRSLELAPGPADERWGSPV